MATTARMTLLPTPGYPDQLTVMIGLTGDAEAVREIMATVNNRVDNNEVKST